MQRTLREREVADLQVSERVSFSKELYQNCSNTVNFLVHGSYSGMFEKAGGWCQDRAKTKWHLLTKIKSIYFA